ncbi:MAG TPA: hypothetical protein VFO16_18165 [Pseudonocardiaceae bacterium]|nr:hypothetical protein [Pseudonocardiaceae bacterium]
MRLALSHTGESGDRDRDNKRDNKEDIMDRNWKRRLSIFSAAAVLVGGLGAVPACSALTAGNGDPRPSVASTDTRVLAAPDAFCEATKQYKRDVLSSNSNKADPATLSADIDRLLATAPAEIRPDVQKAIAPLLMAEGKLRPDQVEPLDPAQFTQVGRNIHAYYQGHCPEIEWLSS